MLKIQYVQNIFLCPVFNCLYKLHNKFTLTYFNQRNAGKRNRGATIPNVELQTFHNKKLLLSTHLEYHVCLFVHNLCNYNYIPHFLLIHLYNPFS